MTRTGQDAIDYARSRVGPNAMPASGYCLQFVRQCFDVGSYYASAIDAWNASPTQHPGDRNPPPAVPLYFLTPSVYDHVTFGGDTGEIITTFNADVRRYTGSDVISQIERDFSGSYLGWCEDINTVRVYTGATPEPEPEPLPIGDDDDMKLIQVIQDGRIFVVTPTLFQHVGDMKTANALAMVYGPWTSMDVTDADAIHNQVNANIVATVANLEGQVNA